MENITIGQIVGAIGIISVIVGFIAGIVNSLMKWWKSKVTDKFTAIDNRFENIEEHINFLEDKKDKYEKIAQDSKEERLILLEGLLACLDGLKQGGANGAVTEAIQKINNYLIDKSHE